MKKKLLATLIATAVLSTGIIGLTACGNPNGDDKGDEKIPDTVAAGVEVTSENWAKAFEDSLAAENFTVKAYLESSYSAKGTDDELGAIDMKITETRSGTAYYDGNTYGKTKVKTVATGVPEDEKWQNRYKNKEYEFETYLVKDGEIYYSAEYSTEKEDAEWSVSTFDTMGGSAISILQTSYATEEKSTTTVALAELYDSFTYADGVYTATLWQYGTEIAVSVSIKDDYVVGYSTEYLYEEEDEDGKESESGKLVYNFSNYGSTTVTPSDAAKKAVEDYKASLSAPSAVAGKTYVYSSLSLAYDDSVSDETIEQYEKIFKTQGEATYTGSTIVFDDNHGFTMTVGNNSVNGTYTESNNVLTLTASTSSTPLTLTLSDYTLTISDSVDSGVTASIIYVEQAE